MIPTYLLWQFNIGVDDYYVADPVGDPGTRPGDVVEFFHLFSNIKISVPLTFLTMIRKASGVKRKGEKQKARSF